MSTPYYNHNISSLFSVYSQDNYSNQVIPNENAMAALSAFQIEAPCGKRIQNFEQNDLRGWVELYLKEGFGHKESYHNE